MYVKRLEEYGKFLAITALSNMKVEDVKKTLEEIRQITYPAEVQIFDADRVAGEEHLFFASLNALNAFENKVNVSKSLAVEILLYASAQRQIKNAIEALGVNEKTSSMAIVAIADEEPLLADLINKIQISIGGKPDDSLLEIKTRDKAELIKRIFKISDVEIGSVIRENVGFEEALKRLIIERIALLSTEV
jgi:tRNA threonylcarbamoyladenosine modification (KEOPS) complex Cgi121 subunit